MEGKAVAVRVNGAANIGHTPHTSPVAGAFIKLNTRDVNYIGCCWIHIDIAGEGAIDLDGAAVGAQLPTRTCGIGRAINTGKNIIIVSH